MVTLLICMLAALPPDQADGLAGGSAASPWPAVTFALQRPPLDTDEGVLLERLAAWDAAFGFSGYAVPLATPTAGGDTPGQLARLGRLAAAVGAERLTVVTPPVGTVGWETSNNAGWLPIGGRPQIVATERESWLATVTASAAGTIALDMVGLTSEPTADQFGEYLDVFIAACQAKGKHAELWLPAAWGLAERHLDPDAVDDDPPLLISVLTPERVLALQRVLWTDVESELPKPALALQTADEPRLPASGGVAPAPKAEIEPSPPAVEEVAIQPTALRAGEAMVEKLTPLASRTPRGLAAIDLVDSPRRPLAQLETARTYLSAARECDFTQLVIRGRMDTPQAPLWRELLVSLRPSS